MLSRLEISDVIFKIPNPVKLFIVLWNIVIAEYSYLGCCFAFLKNHDLQTLEFWPTKPVRTLKIAQSKVRPRCFVQWPLKKNECVVPWPPSPRLQIQGAIIMRVNTAHINLWRYAELPISSIDWASFTTSSLTTYTWIYIWLLLQHTFQYIFD